MWNKPYYFEHMLFSYIYFYVKIFIFDINLPPVKTNLYTRFSLVSSIFVKKNPFPPAAVLWIVENEKKIRRTCTHTNFTRDKKKISK